MSIDLFDHNWRKNKNNISNYINGQKQKKKITPSDDIGNRISMYIEENIVDDNIGNNVFGAPSHLKSSVLADLNYENRGRKFKRTNFKYSNCQHGSFHKNKQIRMREKVSSKLSNDRIQSKKNNRIRVKVRDNIYNNRQLKKTPSYLEKTASLFKRSQYQQIGSITEEAIKQKMKQITELAELLFNKTDHGIKLEFESFDDDNLYGICIFIDDKKNKKCSKFFNQVSVLFALNHLLTKIINFDGKNFANVVLVIKKESSHFETLLKNLV